jgi:heptose-I-phosphate ethanolaminephosphotransferase
MYWKQNIILLVYPLFLSFILEVCIHEIEFSTFLNLAENILFTIITFLVINQVSNFKLGNKIAALIIVFFYIFFLIETGLYLLFQTRMNASYIYVILSTNYDEVKEFSLVYYSNNLIWLLLFFIPIKSFFSKKIHQQVKVKSINVIVSLVFIFIMLIFLKHSKLIVYNLPYISIKSYIQYQEQIESIKEFNITKKNIETKSVAENDVIVVIIGESTTSKHMGIYGYKRNTTPKLKELSDSLIVYKNVISPHVFTTGSMLDILTLSNYENQKTSNTLIDYLKNAKYQVFWLSNQRPVGTHDNIISQLASAADESLFLAYNDYRNTTLYDEVLLPILDEKLKVKGKKVIFLHLIGSHYDYRKRYPKGFDTFFSKIKNNKTQIIDKYDNTILYNDFIVSEVIKIVSKREEKSAVIYFSDHGEEIYDVADFFGHFEDKPTSTMYEVPFLVYMSPAFEKPTDFLIDKTRVFMLDDFPHSLTHFMGIESELLKKNRSIFSSKFVKRKRVILNNKNFDSIFK